MVTAIIVAAGESRRMGFDKLFAPLAGKPVVAHSIGNFNACRDIQQIIVVTRTENVGRIQEMASKEKWKKLDAVVEGGADRHLSVWNGLQAVDARKTLFVAVHDGARPLTTPKLISQCVKLAEETGAACCASPIPDTVKRASADQVVTESVDRGGLWAMQTPQIFSSALILQAYAAVIANNDTVTDEVSAIQRLGKKIALLRTKDWNFKITYPEDLELAERILELRPKK
jgi:2-C-methyl-D-erythritol 4-phosphate cytidylyltransferase